MTVRVLLFATFAAYLPPGSDRDFAVLEVPEDATVDDVAARLGIPPGLARIALVNGQEADLGQRLAPGDEVALFPPLAGGSSERAATALSRSACRPGSPGRSPS